MKATIPNRIASGTLTLPIAIVIGAVVWALKGWDMMCIEMCICAALAAVTTYVLMEMNNRNALIRIRTRITSSVFWMAVASMPFVYLAPVTMFVTLCMAISLALLFNCYEQPHPVLHVFHSFVLVALAAVLCPPLLLFIPVYWLYLFFSLHAMSSRVFMASLLGTTLVVVAVFLCDYPQMQLQCLAITTAELQNGSWFATRMDKWVETYGNMTLDNVAITWLLSLLCGLIGIRHYIVQSFDDKIRTRMLNYIVLTQWLVLQLLAVLLPWRLPQLLPVIWLNTAPLVGHHMALSRTRLSTIWFLILILILYPLSLFLYNIV